MTNGPTISIPPTETLAVVKIDPEFAALCDPLSESERRLLEENILADGCRDPLVAWRGILLDGHNRHSICNMNGLSYKVVEVELPDRDAAFNWIDNQLGRRNVTPERQSYLRGKRYNREKGPRGGNTRVCPVDKTTTGRTNERLAAEYKVSSKTIDKDGDFAAAVDKLAAVHGPEIREHILARDTNITKKAVIEAADAPTPEEQMEVLSKPRRAARPAESPKPKDEPVAEETNEIKGVGVIRANEAINSLIRIPKNDALRKRGFQLVTDWIKANK